MPLDLSTFNPSNAGELASAITSDVSQMGQRWWQTNSQDVEGYIRSLAEATVQTTTALADGRIKEAQAKMILDMQKVAYQNTLNFGKFMTMALAQRVIDRTFQIIGAAIMNRTGLNLFPGITPGVG